MQISRNSCFQAFDLRIPKFEGTKVFNVIIVMNQLRLKFRNFYFIRFWIFSWSVFFIWNLYFEQLPQFMRNLVLLFLLWWNVNKFKCLFIFPGFLYVIRDNGYCFNFNLYFGLLVNIWRIFILRWYFIVEYFVLWIKRWFCNFWHIIL